MKIKKTRKQFKDNIIFKINNLVRHDLKKYVNHTVVLKYLHGPPFYLNNSYVLFIRITLNTLSL